MLLGASFGRARRADALREGKLQLSVSGVLTEAMAFGAEIVGLRRDDLFILVFNPRAWSKSPCNPAFALAHEASVRKTH